MQEFSTVGLNLPTSSTPDPHCSLHRTAEELENSTAKFLYNALQEPGDAAGNVINNPPPLLDFMCFDWCALIENICKYTA